MIRVFFLLTEPMLIGRNNLFVGLPIVAIKGGLSAVSLRQGLPQTQRPIRTARAAPFCRQ